MKYSEYVCVLFSIASFYADRTQYITFRCHQAHLTSITFRVLAFLKSQYSPWLLSQFFLFKEYVRSIMFAAHIFFLFDRLLLKIVLHAFIFLSVFSIIPLSGGFSRPSSIVILENMQWTTTSKSKQSFQYMCCGMTSSRLSVPRTFPAWA